jgi:Na+/proline symporter
MAAITLLYHIGGNSWNLANGFRALTHAVPELTHRAGYVITGFETPRVDKWMNEHHLTAMSVWQYFKLIFLSEYTVFSALIGATIGNVAAFGTDQDMVQRMLTAETYQKSRRSLIMAALMDLPISATFTFIGILLIAYYKMDPTYKPAGSSDVFGSYILNVMPVGIRGLVLAGVFATAMGSLSTALNALATSATNDWYIPYFARHKSDANHVTAARVFTGLFALLMIATAVVFAFFKIKNPEVRIIPVVLGIAGFILGPMLGVFLLGMLTKSRGNDFGNMIAVTLGLIVTIVMGGLHVDFAKAIAPNSPVTAAMALFQLKYVPTVAFTWYPMVGAIVVLIVGLFFRTPESVLESARRRANEAEFGDDTPISLRR